ncbi:MAG: hypothetical protein GY851_17295, partial [bacterium]|nr:hypothetical protein [bacterium]
MKSTALLLSVLICVAGCADETLNTDRTDNAGTPETDAASPEGGDAKEEKVVKSEEEWRRLLTPEQ